MKRFRWEIGILLSLMLWAGACSSTQTKDDDGTDAVPVADAGTDAVPQPTADTPSPTPAPDAGTTAASADTSPPAASAPAASAPAAAPQSDDGSPGSYTVQAGDTLMKIAFENLGDLYKWKEIYEANKDKIKIRTVFLQGLF